MEQSEGSIIYNNFNGQYDATFKLILIGDSGVSKTS